MAQGKLGSLDLAAGGAGVVLFTAAVTPQVFNIRFANRNAFNVKVRVAIGAGGAPAAADWVDYDVSILGNGILEDTGFSATSGENVWVISDTANVSVRAHGV